MRMLVALLFHAPGLRLFYGHRLSPRDFRANLAAVASTVMAMAGAYALYRGIGAACAFAAGHLLWGLYLAARVR